MNPKEQKYFSIELVKNRYAIAQQNLPSEDNFGKKKSKF